MGRPSFTVEQCQEQLAKWLDASTKLAEGKTVSIGTRSLSRANADEVKTMIEMWEKRMAEAERGSRGPRIRLVNPL